MEKENWEERFDKLFSPFIAYKSIAQAISLESESDIQAHQLEHCENEVKTFIQNEIENVRTEEASKCYEHEKKARLERGWEYFNAFAEYVSLGAENFEPEALAKQVIEQWEEKSKQDYKEKVIAVLESITVDKSIYQLWNDFIKPALINKIKSLE